MKMQDTVVYVASIFVLFFFHIESFYIGKDKKGALHGDDEFSQLERRQKVSGFLEIHGTRFESLGCWKDAWTRALPTLEGAHYLLMDPNYKGRTQALFKCARAAREKKLKMFGLENGGQCFGSAALDTRFKKYGPAIDCPGDGRGGPWSMEVYRFDDSTMSNNRENIHAKYGSWSLWSACSRKCGAGVTLRKRTCYGPLPFSCKQLGPNVESSACNVKPCAGKLIIGEVESNNFFPVYPVRKQQKTALPNGAHLRPYTGPRSDPGKMAARPNSQMGFVNTQQPGQTSHSLSSGEKGTLAMTGTPLQQHPVLKPSEVSIKHQGKAIQAFMLHNRPEPSVKQPNTASYRVSKGDKSGVQILSGNKIHRDPEAARYLAEDFYTPAPTLAPTPPQETGISSDVQEQRGSQDTSGVEKPNNAKGNSVSYEEGDEGSTDMKPSNQTKHQERGNDLRLSNATNSNQGNSSSLRTSNTTNSNQGNSSNLMASNTTNSNQSNHQDQETSSGFGLSNETKSNNSQTNDYSSTPEAGFVETEGTQPESSGEADEQQMADQQQMQQNSHGLVYNQPINGQQMNHVTTQSMEQVDQPENQDNKENNDNNDNIEMAKQEDQSTAEANNAQYQDDSLPQESEFEETSPGQPTNLNNSLGAEQTNNMLGKQVAEKETKMRNQDTSQEKGQENTNDDSAQCLCPRKVCSAHADLAFVVDSSADIPQPYFYRVLQFVKALSRGFDLKGAHIGLVAYGSDARPAFNLKALRDFTELDNFVDTASYVGGDLKTGNALLKSKINLFALSGRQDVPRALVLFSSGSSSDDVTTPSEELRDSGVKVTAIGLGKLANVRELINTASEPKAEHVFTAFLDTLPDTMDDIVQGVCKDVLGIIRERREPCPCADGPPDVQQTPVSDYTGNKNSSGESPTAQILSESQTGAAKITNSEPVDQEDIEARPEQSGPTGEVWKQAVQSQNESAGGYASLPPASQGVQVLDGPETPSSDNSSHLPAYIPEPAVTSVGSISVASQEGAAAPLAYDPKGIGNQAGSYHQLAEAGHASTDNHTQEYQGCDSVNLGIVLDSSAGPQGAATEINRKMVELVKKITHFFPVSPKGNRVGMLVYSGLPKPSVVRFDNFQDQDSMDKAIDDARNPNLEVKIGKALDFARDHLFRNVATGKHNVLLLVTDGTSSDNVTKPAIELKRRNVEIFCFGVGEGVVKTELAAIASEPARDHVFISPVNQAHSLLGSIRSTICRSSKSATNQNTRRRCATDLEFLVDGSRSIEVLGRGNFKKVLQFVKNVTKGLYISPEGTRVGLTVYGSEPSIAVPMHNFSDSESLSLAIDRAPYPATAKMTGKALELAKKALFDVGSRSNAPKVLVVLTGGTSKDSVKRSSADLHRLGVRVISVGLGPIHDKQELSDMASMPLAANIILSRFPHLRYKVTELQDRICLAARGGNPN